MEVAYPPLSRSESLVLQNTIHYSVQKSENGPDANLQGRISQWLYLLPQKFAFSMTAKREKKNLSVWRKKPSSKPQTGKHALDERKTGSPKTGAQIS